MVTRIKNILFFLFLIALPAFNFGQPLNEMFGKRLLALDSLLSNHNDQWKPKISKGPFNLNTSFSKVSFGPFKTIQTGKEDVNELAPPKKYLDLFLTYQVTSKSHVIEMTVLYNNDTTTLNLLFTSTNESWDRTFTGSILFGFKDKSDERNTIVCREMLIKLSNDSLFWHFVPANPINQLNHSDDLGILKCGTDSLEIKYVKGFKGFTKTFADTHTGIVILKDNIQLAALQLQGKSYVYLTTLADEKTRALIGSVMIALLGMGVE